MVRLILGILAGLFVAVALVFGIEMIGHSLYPPPEGVDLKDPETLKTLMSEIPLGAKLAVMMGWFSGALGGGITAALIARRGWAAWVISAIMLCLTAMTLSVIPHPMWMIGGAIALPILAGAIASRFGKD